MTATFRERLSFEPTQGALMDQTRRYFLTVASSPFAAGFGASESPVCQPILGMLRAVSGMVFGRATEVRGTECTACGARACRFEARTREAAG